MVQEHDQNSRYLATIAAQENLAVPNAVDEEHAQLRDALAGERGATFDNSYMTAMLKDHQQMASLLKSSEAAVSTDELRTFIKKTLPVVEHHLRMAQDVAQE
jgi:putative membrane protein